MRYKCNECQGSVQTGQPDARLPDKCPLCGAGKMALRELADIDQATEQTKAGEPATDQRLAGIGGWLILPAIGLVIGPIITIIALLLRGGVVVADGVLYALALPVEMALLFFLIYAATRFFGKRKDAPSILIALMIARLVVIVVFLVAESTFGAEEVAKEGLTSLIFDIIGAAIWIPYFMVSKRVKATFVN